MGDNPKCIRIQIASNRKSREPVRLPGRILRSLRPEVVLLRYEHPILIYSNQELRQGNRECDTQQGLCTSLVWV